jgi:hypothetical protein
VVVVVGADLSEEEQRLLHDLLPLLVGGGDGGEHLLEPADLDAQGVRGDAADVEVLLLEEQLV